MLPYFFFFLFAPWHPLSSSITLQCLPSAQRFAKCANGRGGFVAFISSSTAEELYFASVSLVVLSPASFLISLLN